VQNKGNNKKMFKPADIQIDVKQTVVNGGPPALKTAIAQDATYKHMECINSM
jgi:hypothetical protein